MLSSFQWCLWPFKKNWGWCEKVVCLLFSMGVGYGACVFSILKELWIVKDNKILKIRFRSFTRRPTWKLCGEDKELDKILEWELNGRHWISKLNVLKKKLNVLLL